MAESHQPLEAYRRDLARLGRSAFGSDDARWLDATALLEQYAAPAGVDRREVGSRLAAFLAIETELTFFNAALQFGREIEEAGALHLAASWLFFLERTVPVERALERGRVRATRARVARRLGDVDLSRSLYSDVERLGESHAEPELTARAWVGFGVIAMERGNNPEARRWFEAAALVADDTGCREESWQAHQGLMIVFGKAGDAERSITEGWLAYRALTIDDERRAELLSNLSQTLYGAGQFESALRGFAAAVRRATQPRILLGALGGVAIAAGALGQRQVVDAAAARIEGLVSSAWSHPVALAYLDLSDAYSMLGEAFLAAEFRREARDIAEVGSHYEELYRAIESAAIRPVAADSTAKLGSSAQLVIDQIEALEAPADLMVG